MSFIVDSKEYWIDHAKDVIFADFVDNVSVEAKNKDLLKFGKGSIGTSKSTIMTLAGSEINETYVSTNIIDTISSSNAGDTEEVTVEGHTISGGVFTFVTQNATLNGQNKVVLGTPLARATRIFNNGSIDLVGSIYCYEDDTVTAGVPNTDTKVHCIVDAGMNNSEKAATTISNIDYWIVTGFYADVLKKSAAFASIFLEIRLKDKVFRNIIDIAAASTGSRADHKFFPYLIVPKNADVRLRAAADSASTDISGGIEGVLAKII